MTRRNKLGKFADILTFPNVYENFNFRDNLLTSNEEDRVYMKGQWRKDHFQNEDPLVLELACGRGEYTNALAEAYPKKNFIGVDIKGARIWKGAKYALAQELDNVAYLRTRIEFIENFFQQDEVDEIWITFPDPFLKEGSENRRLTSPPFLDRYRNILKKDGIIHLKTDDDTLYEYSLEIGQSYPHIDIEFHHDDIYQGELPIDELAYKTYYEIKHLAAGKKIKYIRFRLH